MTVNERIKKIRVDRGESLESFGAKIGITKSALSMIERGINNPSKQTIEFICREFHINKIWLETGEGEVDAPELDEIAEIVSSVLNESPGDPDFDDTLAFMRDFLKLDPLSKKVVINVIDAFLEAKIAREQQAAKNAKKDPE